LDETESESVIEIRRISIAKRLGTRDNEMTREMHEKPPVMRSRQRNLGKNMIQQGRSLKHEIKPTKYAPAAR
jgi:hypothetical protein